MDEVLQNVYFATNDNVLGSSGHSEDAGVFKLSDDLALVQTTDFFTPVVDDPYLFGQIAAVNALSDIYAMGARPVSALNIACFPDIGIDAGTLTMILQGGADKVAESGAVIIGGHTIKDKELKYGLAVTGLIKPADIKPNNAVQAGDQLLLTKPLGTGILTTGIKNDYYTESDIPDVIKSMLLLNRAPAELLGKYQARAVTDISGFGLLGHLREMLLGNQLGIELNVAQIPCFDQAIPLARAGKFIPGGTLSNIKYVEPLLDMGSYEVWNLNLLADPQTSGGLLIAMDRENVQGFCQELKDYPFEVCEIGEVISGPNKIILS